MSRMFKVTPTKKPKWYQVRHRTASLIVRLAKWIHPNNPDVYSFYAEMLMEQAIYGSTIIKHGMEDET